MKIRGIFRKGVYLFLKPRIFLKCKSSKKKYDSYYLKHQGEKCFIVANGPSLTIDDLNVLSNNKIITFGINKIFVLFDKTNWRPNYYVASDSKVIKSCKKEFEQIGCPFFTRVIGLKKTDISNAIYFNGVDPNKKWKNNRPEFMDGTHQKIVCGKTVTYVAMQLAIYMGFKEIYLIGCDCNYNVSSNNQIINGSYADNRMAIKGASADTGLMIKTYESAKEYADTHNVKIYNATRGGNLEVFERINFDDLFK
ncbi:MAG: 6-hydroxymethylpterin diphosphokinase MptE-like protein [Bacilli bacterium]